MNHFDVAPLSGHDPQIGLLLASLEDSTREWRKNLGEPSVEALQWQIEPGSYSVGALLLHLIDVEDSWLRQFLAGGEEIPEETTLLLSEETKQIEGIWPPAPAYPFRWYIELHDRIRERAFEAIKGIPADRVYERGARSCTTRWVVAHVLEHDSYTGGQAVAMHELWQKMRGT